LGYLITLSHVLASFMFRTVNTTYNHYPRINQAPRGTLYFKSSQSPGGGWWPGGRSG